MDFINQHRTAFYIESVLLVILGMIAIAAPFYATLSIELIIAWVLLFGGIAQLYKSIQTFKNPGGAISLVSALIYIVTGILMLVYPMTGIMSLTLLVGIFFALEGLTKIVFSFKLKPAENWGWLLFSGIIALLMAAIILSGWPATSLWVIGLLVGINLLFFGFSLFAIAFNAPKQV
jgi:uncharacterized membrane protein HdeD (DUF308 family)